MVFQPRYTAFLNLIEPWWKILCSLALKGRRFESWEEIEQAVQQTTAGTRTATPSLGDSAAIRPADHLESHSFPRWPDLPDGPFSSGLHNCRPHCN